MIETKKTFSEIIEEGYTYPEGVDAITQATIYDWFQFRRVTDNARFGAFFNRVLNRDYHRYRQLIRIEAGTKGDTNTYTNFDWLVTEYLERQEKREYNGSEERDGTRAGQTTNGGTHGTVYGGTTVTETEGEGSTTHGLSVATTNTSQSQSSDNSATDTGATTETRAGALTRNQPNSQSYTQADLNANDNRRGYITDSTDGYNVGEKDYGQSTEGDSFTVGLHKNFPELNIKNPTATSDTHTTVGAIEKTKGESSSTGSDTTTGTTTNSGTDRTANENTTTTRHGQTINVTDTGTGTESGTSHDESTTESTGKTQTQHTGRNGEIAEILNRAKEYIETTSAWDWFRGQLETCFMACID